MSEESPVTDPTRVAIALDPDLGVAPAAFVAAWAQDAQARAVGVAEVGITGNGTAFVPGLLELVIIPLVVNLGSNGLYDLVKRLVTSQSTTAVSEIETTEIVIAQGDRVIVVRTRRSAA
jgi:hypothetical protein